MTCNPANTTRSKKRFYDDFLSAYLLTQLRKLGGYLVRQAIPFLFEITVCSIMANARGPPTG